MALVSLHPKSQVKAKVHRSHDGSHRWIELTVDDTTVVIHQAANTGRLCVRAIAEELAGPHEDLWSQQQAAEHDSMEAAGGLDQSNTLAIHETDDIPF